MAGAIYNSYEDVRLGKAQTDAAVQQTFTSYAAALGQPLDFSGGPTTYTAVTLEALMSADAGSTDKKKLQTDAIAFYVAWTSFMGTGTDQTSTLWFPNFPDDAEWATLVQYQTSLAALQKRIAALYPSSAIVPTTPATGSYSPWSLFPSLAPAQDATLTSVVYVGVGLALLYTFGPLVHDAAEAWSPSPKPSPK